MNHEHESPEPDGRPAPGSPSPAGPEYERSRWARGPAGRSADRYPYEWQHASEEPQQPDGAHPAHGAQHPGAGVPAGGAHAAPGVRDAVTSERARWGPPQAPDGPAWAQHAHAPQRPEGGAHPQPPHEWYGAPGESQPRAPHTNRTPRGPRAGACQGVGSPPHPRFHRGTRSSTRTDIRRGRGRSTRETAPATRRRTCTTARQAGRTPRRTTGRPRSHDSGGVRRPRNRSPQRAAAASARAAWSWGPSTSCAASFFRSSSV